MDERIIKHLKTQLEFYRAKMEAERISSKEMPPSIFVMGKTRGSFFAYKEMIDFINNLIK